MAIVYTSSEGKRELLPNEAVQFPYAITLNSAMMTRYYYGHGGRHPILRKNVHDWCLNKNNIRESWYCEYIKTSHDTGYSVIRFKNMIDATMFRLSF